MDSAYERMREVIKALGYTSNEKFEDAVGLGHGFVSRITSKFTKKATLAIANVHPQVNMNYVRTGMGEMFVEKQTVIKDTPKERLQQYLVFKGIMRSEFIKNTGLATNFPLMSNGGKFSPKTIYKVNSVYPDINMDWLATGMGDMIQEECDLFEEGNYKDRLRIFCDEAKISPLFFLTKCNFYAKSIMRLPDSLSESLSTSIKEAFPMLNMGWVKTGKGKMLNDAVNSIPLKNISFIPLVTQVVRNTYRNNCFDEDYISGLPTMPFIKDGNGKYVAFEIDDDSMDDGSSRAYQNGDIAICKLCYNCVTKDDGHLCKGMECVVVSKNDVRVKQIVGFDSKKGQITLHSFNPIYKDVTLDLNDVRQVFSVEFQQKKRGVS